MYFFEPANRAESEFYKLSPFYHNQVTINQVCTKSKTETASFFYLNNSSLMESISKRNHQVGMREGASTALVCGVVGTGIHYYHFFNDFPMVHLVTEPVTFHTQSRDSTTELMRQLPKFSYNKDKNTDII